MNEITYRTIMRQVAQIEERLVALEKRTANRPDNQVRLSRCEKFILEQFERKTGTTLVPRIRTNRKPSKGA